MYEIDLGDHREMWSYKAIRTYYAHNIDHSEYKDFEEWFIDMQRNGLIQERR